MSFTYEEEQILRKRALLIDTGDGLGTFTLEDIAKLKDIITIYGETKEGQLAKVAAELGMTEPETPARWIPPCTVAPTPAWQPADITAETLVAKPGQGAKL